MCRVGRWTIHIDALSEFSLHLWMHLCVLEDLLMIICYFDDSVDGRPMSVLHIQCTSNEFVIWLHGGAWVDVSSSSNRQHVRPSSLLTDCCTVYIQNCKSLIPSPPTPSTILSYRYIANENNWTLFYTGCPGSWKVMEFRNTSLQAWKVIENDCEGVKFLELHKLLTVV